MSYGCNRCSILQKMTYVFNGTCTGRDDEHALSIFKMVIDLYLTIRGFAFV